MGVRERVAPRQDGWVHACQFFDSEESRAGAAATFIAEGLGGGEHVIVIARPLHWSAIFHHLETQRVPVELEVGRGRLIVKDAMDTLRRLSPSGVPAQAAFDATVGTSIRALSKLGPLRAYGEMVDILAQRGDLRETIQLEELWNQLGQHVRFSLLCGYSAAHFVSPTAHEALRDICSAHSAVHRDEHDALANWLLTAAHHPITPSSSVSH
jgi:hypothetical protein